MVDKRIAPFHPNFFYSEMGHIFLVSPVQPALLCDLWRWWPSPADSTTFFSGTCVQHRAYNLNIFTYSKRVRTVNKMYVPAHGVRFVVNWTRNRLLIIDLLTELIDLSWDYVRSKIRVVWLIENVKVSNQIQLGDYLNCVCACVRFRMFDFDLSLMNERFWKSTVERSDFCNAL